MTRTLRPADQDFAQREPLEIDEKQSIAKKGRELHSARKNVVRQ